MKKYLLLFLVLCLSGSLFLYDRSNSEIISLPLDDEKGYTEQVNLWLLEKKQAHDVAKQNIMAEQQAKEEVFWGKLISSAEAAVRRINFYAKVVDQYGEPVSGVTVKYKARSQYLAAGTGFGETVTNELGEFNTKGVKGVGFDIVKFSKVGHQFNGDYFFDNFQSHKNSVLWKNYTKKNPFIFKAWKVERYPRVKNVERQLYLFTPDGRVGTFDLLANQKERLKKGVKSGDFTVSFLHKNEEWSVQLEAINGGIQETEDIYRNLAPESNYKKLLSYDLPMNYSDSFKRHYYIKMRDGNYYGQLTIEFRMDYRGKGAVFISYVINLENGRNLTVKQN